MSVFVSGPVWKFSKEEGGTLLVLLALADWADDEGYCYPGIFALSKKARLTERHTRRILRELEEKGAIQTVQNTGRNGTNTYRVIIPKAPAEESSEKMSSGKTPRHLEPETRTPASEKTDTHTSQTVSDTSEQPSKAESGKTEEEVVFPPILCTPAFGVKWEEWMEYRRKEKRQPLGVPLQRRQLTLLASFGEAGARQSIKEAMDAGWTGLFPPKKGGQRFQGKTGGTFDSSQYGDDPFGERRETA